MLFSLKECPFTALEDGSLPKHILHYFVVSHQGYHYSIVRLITLLSKSYFSSHTNEEVDESGDTDDSDLGLNEDEEYDEMYDDLIWTQ